MPRAVAEVGTSEQGRLTVSIREATVPTEAEVYRNLLCPTRTLAEAMQNGGPR